ncbi:MAG: rRNA pseudouridine synthase [Acidobacteria bacterium]|nr:rRNA pseudouridine synthase [Acidobacteriota bacterium]MBS1866173.1 rRNA pseudouridine synthase [Acidobacteriota bacterium]
MKRQNLKTGREKKTGLARALSKMGFCSRSEAAELIRTGRVRLNGVVRRDAEHPVRLGRDRIEVDGKGVRAAEKAYWMMNKPRGIVTTAADEKGRATVYALLSKDLPWMGPVGRLDMASEGLLLLTNDTEWAARIAAPESHVEKTYHVQIGAVADRSLQARLEAGVLEGGELLRASSARLLRAGEKNSWVEIVLDEGKNRQIRRMFDACGVEVLRLIRVAIGPVKLGELAKGKARELMGEEIRALRG